MGLTPTPLLRFGVRGFFSVLYHLCKMRHKPIAILVDDQPLQYHSDTMQASAEYDMLRHLLGSQRVDYVNLDNAVKIA